MEAEGETA